MRALHLAFIVLLAACPSDPAFEGSDLFDTGGTLATDTTSDPEADATAPCLLPCGPGAHCEDDRCVCDTPSCDTVVPIVSDATGPVAIALHASLEPTLAYARPGGAVEVTAFAGASWATPVPVGDTAGGLSMALDRLGRRVLLFTGPSANAEVHWEVDTFDLLGDAPACDPGTIVKDPDGDDVLVGCVDPAVGMMTFFASAAPIEGLVALPEPLLDIGDPIGRDGITSGEVRWAPNTEDLFVAFSYRANVEQHELWVAETGPDDWIETLLDVVAAPSDGEAPRVAIAIDSLGGPHVLAVVGPTPKLRHYHLVGTSWVEKPQAIDATGVGFIEATTAAGSGVHLVLGHADRLSWRVVASHDGDEHPGAALPLTAGTAPRGVALVSDPRSEARPAWIAYTRDDGELHLWRPELAPPVSE